MACSGVPNHQKQDCLNRLLALANLYFSILIPTNAPAPATCRLVLAVSSSSCSKDSAGAPVEEGLISLLWMTAYVQGLGCRLWVCSKRIGVDLPGMDSRLRLYASGLESYEHSFGSLRSSHRLALRDFVANVIPRSRRCVALDVICCSLLAATATSPCGLGRNAEAATLLCLVRPDRTAVRQRTF